MAGVLQAVDGLVFESDESLVTTIEELRDDLREQGLRLGAGCRAPDQS